MHPCILTLALPAQNPGPKSAAVSESLDCLSSIVERISTESPAAPALLLGRRAAGAVSPGPQEAAAVGSEVEWVAPPPLPPTLPSGLAGANPNPIYQVP